MLPLFLLFTACNLVENAATQALVTTTSNAAHLPESIGVVATPTTDSQQTLPPEYVSYPTTTSFHYYLVKILGNDGAHLSYSDLKIQGTLSSGASQTIPAGGASVSGGVTQGTPYNVQIQFSEAVHFDRLLIRPNANGVPTHFIVYGSNTNFSSNLVKLYEGANLIPTRAHIWTQGQDTPFVTSSTVCSAGSAPNNLGVCQPIRFLCSDLDSVFSSSSSKRCAVFMNGEGVACSPVANETECQALIPSLCTIISPYVEYSGNLAELYYEGTRIQSKTCL